MTQQTTRSEPETSARVVVVGAGFAGGSFLQNLPSTLREPGAALLVDRQREYVFVPLIHEVAVGRIHPDSISTSVAPHQGLPYGFLRAEATGVDLDSNTLLTSSGPVAYDYLVLAPGGVAALPPEGSSDHLQTFWNLNDALRLRNSLNTAWQAGVSRKSPQPGALTVAIVGGGATGVELAAEIAALFDYLRKRTARKPLVEPRVVLLEATDRLMDWLDPYFHEAALKELTRLGIEVRLNTPVEAANAEGVRAGGEWLPAATRVWTAGIVANPLIKALPGEHDVSGRVRVDEHLTLPDHPEVYVLGDGALYEHPRLGPLPPTASVAVQHGPYAARDIGLRVHDARERRRRPFEFFDRGYAVSLGPESAVADPLGIKLRGRAAQALYRGVFLYYMKNRRGRLMSGADWAMERTLGRVGFDAVASH